MNVTIKDRTATRGQLAQWIRRNYRPQINLSETLAITDKLLDSQTWVTFDYYLGGGATATDLVNLEFVQELDPYLENMKAGFAQQRIYSDLRDKGAAGDAEAAIEYCRLAKEGKVNYAAYG